MNEKKCICQSTRGQDLAAQASNDSSVSLRCPVCVQQLLQSHLDRHQEALSKRNQARQQCARQLQELRQQPDLSELQFHSQQLRNRLETRRTQNAQLAVQVAAHAVENEERQEDLHNLKPNLYRQQLQRLEKTLCSEGALQHAIATSSDKVRLLRFQWAVQAFTIHRLDADQETEVSTHLRHRHARGIGKIGGLPLPNAGLELYGFLPPQGLQSALRLVASLCSTVARCLGIILPHPILLHPDGPSGDIIDYEVPKKHSSSTESLVRGTVGANSLQTTTLVSLMDTASSWGVLTRSWGRTAKHALALATGQQAQQQTTEHHGEDETGKKQGTLDPSLVSLRLHHAMAAVIAEDDSPTSSRYALSAKVMHQDEFAVGLQLLQNNVVGLAIRAGVPVANLWPAESLLLNLHALHVYCADQVPSLS